MKFSISSAFILVVLFQAAYIASASPLSEQQCQEKFGTGHNNNNNNNGGGTKTLTVTATHAVTRTVTVGSTSTSTANKNKNSSNSNSNDKNNSNSNNNGSSSNNSKTSTSSNSNNNANNNNNNNKNNGGGDFANEQTSLQLDPSIIGSNLAHNGLSNGTEAGQVASLTSTNNFINFCAKKQITNGQQFADGTTSCNPVVMGDIPAKTNMISCKFASPQNFATIQSNIAFDIAMTVSNFQTGAFTNPNTNYFAAPQQLNSAGDIIGHSHFVIQSIKSLQDTTVSDPTTFSFFQGVNAPAVNGKLTISVTKGLPAGVYRIASINTAGNHQPALVPVAQHGSMDDIIYITVSDKVGAAPPAVSSTDTASASSVATTPISSVAATSSTKSSSVAVSKSSAAASESSSVAPAASNGGNNDNKDKNDNKGKDDDNKGSNNTNRGGRKVRRFQVSIL